MEWYYVWWRWLTSKHVAQVCQHQLSFLLVVMSDCTLLNVYSSDNIEQRFYRWADCILHSVCCCYLFWTRTMSCRCTLAVSTMHWWFILCVVVAGSNIFILTASGATEPRGPGGQLTPTFSGAGSTYGAWPLTFCRVHLCPICSCSYSFIHLFIQLLFNSPQIMIIPNIWSWSRIIVYIYIIIYLLQQIGR